MVANMPPHSPPHSPLPCSEAAVGAAAVCFPLLKSQGLLFPLCPSGCLLCVLMLWTSSACLEWAPLGLRQGSRFLNTLLGLCSSEVWCTPSREAEDLSGLCRVVLYAALSQVTWLLHSRLSAVIGALSLEDSLPPGWRGSQFVPVALQ